MAHDESFTLDLFGATPVSGGLDFGVTAKAVGLAHGADDVGPSVSQATTARAGERRISSSRLQRGQGFRLDGDRRLAGTWKDRARDNIAAIQLASEIEREHRPATEDEQRKLIRFIGFGASELANATFRRPGEREFRKSWEEIGADLQDAVSETEYASLARCTQYAHFTPEPIARAIWAGLQRLGWRGGRVLEPGVGTGLFAALMPGALAAHVHVTGVEIDPVTARIARLLQPRARIINADFARTEFPANFDLAIGNPPFSDRIVKSDRSYRALALRLHDYFIARSIDLLKPGGLAAFVTSHGTMDKGDAGARQHIAKSADLIAAIRLPERSFRAEAGTDVVVDILFFRKRKPGEVLRDTAWLDLAELRTATADEGALVVNRWFAEHPSFVLGTHTLTSGPYGETYSCMPSDFGSLEEGLAAAIQMLPEGIYDGEPEMVGDGSDEEGSPALPAPIGETRLREGSYVFDASHGLKQIVDGVPVSIRARKGRSGEGISEKQIRIVTKLIPIRDAIREVLKRQEQDRPWKDPQVRLRVAWSSFVREFGPINHTTVSITEDEATGEVRESHRRPNLQPFLDDPDCWLVASIENYDLDTDTAKPGPIFSERVIAPPSPPVIASTADALAVVLNERGRVDLDQVAELVHKDVQEVIEDLGDVVFQDPADGSWQMADAYLSGAVRDKLKVAEAVAELDPAFARNVRALLGVQPADLGPSDITARLGSPWIPAADVVAFVGETMDAEIRIFHMPELASWTVEARQLGWTAAGTSEWGTDRRHAGELLADALNSRVPQIFDTIKDEAGERRVLNVIDTEAAREKLQKIKTAFLTWVWSDAERTDRLARVYNDRFNNIAPRAFNGDHLQLPGTCHSVNLYPHQKRGIWRIMSSGSHYRMPEPKPAKGKAASVADKNDAGEDEGHLPGAARPEVSRRGVEMIGDFRTDALHEAIARAPIEDDTLTALLVLALAGRNVSVQSGASHEAYGAARLERHAAALVNDVGELSFDRNSLRASARAILIDVMSARQNRTDSGIVARIAGGAIGADSFLPNMATETFLECLSRPALEQTCANTSVLPRPRVRDTRTALVERFKEDRFVHPAALFAPDKAQVTAWLTKNESAENDEAAEERDEAETEVGFDLGEAEEVPYPAVGEDAHRIAAE